MRQLKERGCSFLIVSHDTSSLQLLCDRGIVLIGGHKHFEGVTRDAIREYHLTEKIHRPTEVSRVRNRKEREESPGELDEIEEPERWFQPKEGIQVTDSLAKLVRWSCADDSGKTVDQFLENQKIRLFVEFECKVPVQEASAGLGIRDKTGQMIHGKHLYQMRPGTKVTSDSAFSLLCEFSFTCRLLPGEYTVEFGLIDISSTPNEIRTDTPVAESYSIIYSGPPVGRFAVTPRDTDPIRRKGHFGIVDVDAEVHFRTLARKL
jgi:lipopolysaccharide transport system ATP-binding protein